MRLKWHQLRRQPEDPPFLRENLRAGLAAGASLEVDIRALADGRFVCLHDAVFDSETSGRGPVVASNEHAVTALRMLESGEPPLLLDELADIVRSTALHPNSLLQLDLCGPIDTADCDAFAATLRGISTQMVLSAYSWDDVTRLGARVRGLALGYDPTEDATRSGRDAISLVREVAPTADWIYLHRSSVRNAHKRGEQLAAAGLPMIDCWTIDHGGATNRFHFDMALAAGCDQITTNSPALWAREMSGSG